LHLVQVQVLRGAFAATKQSPDESGDCFGQEIAALAMTYVIGIKIPSRSRGGWGGNPRWPSSTSFPRECGEPTRAGDL